MAQESGPRGIVVMDPRGASEPMRVPMAARPTTLDGKVMVLLDNNKTNANRLVTIVGELIRSKYDLRDVKVTLKPDSSRPAPKELMDRMTAEEHYDFAIVAVGD